MREKAYRVLKKCYGVLMNLAFWGGILPLLPFLVAIIMGGENGESIAIFLYRYYYPWVIVLASSAVLVGLISMYVGKREDSSVKKQQN